MTYRLEGTLGYNPGTHVLPKPLGDLNPIDKEFPAAYFSMDGFWMTKTRGYHLEAGSPNIFQLLLNHGLPSFPA
jgi:hypothetical protein